MYNVTNEMQDQEFKTFDIYYITEVLCFQVARVSVLVLLSQYLRNSLRKFLQNWHKHTFGVMDEFHTFKGQGHCDLTPVQFSCTLSQEHLDRIFFTSGTNVHLDLWMN